MQVVKPTSSVLFPTLVFLALLFGWIGYKLWNARAEHRQEQLEALGLENFNETQMRVWKNCDSIEQSLSVVYQKLEGLDSATSNAKDTARRLSLPKECHFLNDLRRQTHAERVRKQSQQ